MFDDKPLNQPGQVPPNLPIGEPEDMFAGSGMDQESAAAVPETPAMPTALGAGILKPKAPQPASVPGPAAEPAPQMPPRPAPGVPPAYPGSPAAPATNYTGMPAEMMPSERSADLVKEPLGGRRGLTGIIVITVLVIVALGSGVIYFTVIRNAGGGEPPASNVTVPPITDIPELVPTPEPEPVEETPVITPTTSVDEKLLFGQPVDTDGDSLDDVREADIGTDYLNWDTDGDALGDGDEVIVWKTDPLNPDTDGDSFPDGTEVKNGYSPTGPGKIFAPAAATST